MSETAGDGGTYITTRHKHVTVYHSTRECSRIEKPEYARERTRKYVEWHGLDRCEYCHD